MARLLYTMTECPQRTVDSPIRLIDDVDPVKGTSNPNMACGQHAQNAALVVPANPGSKVTFDWASGQGGNVRICCPWLLLPTY